MLCPDLSHPWMLINLLVHRGLGKARFIAFIMPIAPVADQVDHKVLAELLTIGKGGTCCFHTCHWIICVDMDDRNFKSFCEIAGKHAATRFALICRKP